MNSKEVSIVNDKEIKGFFGDYRWLSNFYPCEVKFEGETFPSTEHAYQAAKWPKEQRAQFLNVTAAESKKLGRKAPLSSTWNTDKEIVMLSLLRAKFSRQNPTLRQKLIETGEKYLEETNWWNDTEWGVCNGIGKNKLGLLLMQVRAEINQLQENFS